MWRLLTSLFCLTLIFYGVSQEIDYKNFLVPPTFNDATSLSFGGIFTISQNGAEALSGNPAGLARTQVAQAVVTGRLTVWGKKDYSEEYYNNYDNYTSKMGMYPKLMNFAFSFPIELNNVDIPFVGALGYRTIYDISNKIYTEYTVSDVNQKQEIKNQGYLNAFSLGVATKLKEKYFVGITINLPIWDKYQYQSERKVYNNNISIMEKYKEIWDVDGRLFFQIGFIANVSENFSIGFNYMSGHNYKLRKGRWVMSNGDVTNSGLYNDIVKITIPGILTFGGSFKVGDNLTLGIELQNNPLDEIEFNGIAFPNVEGGSILRMGMEYSENFHLRAGFQLQKLPIMDFNNEPVKLKTFTMGTDIPISNFIFKLASTYDFATYDEKVGNATAEFLIRNWTILATIKYYFNFSLKL